MPVRTRWDKKQGKAAEPWSSQERSVVSSVYSVVCGWKCIRSDWTDDDEWTSYSAFISC